MTTLLGTNEYLQKARLRGWCDPMSFDSGYGDRSRMVREYSWAIPNDAALDALANRAPLVEIGAGGGYWAHLLRERDVDIVAYDPELWHTTEPGIKEKQRVWTEVELGGGEAVARHRDRTLFLCWPSYRDDWSDLTLEAYMDVGGQTVALIGEDEYGCTGSERFHDLLRAHFDEVAEVEIPQWPGIHDYLGIWERR